MKSRIDAEIDVKGSALVQVLVTAVIVSVIAAGLMRMTMMRHTLVARGTDGVGAQRRAEQVMSQLFSRWNADVRCGIVAGYTRTAAGSVAADGLVCGCTYTCDGRTTITTNFTAGKCNIVITSKAASDP